MPDPKEEYLQQLHEDYLAKVTESGMPIWLLQQYGQAQPTNIPEPKKTEQQEQIPNDNPLPF